MHKNKEVAELEACESGTVEARRLRPQSFNIARWMSACDDATLISAMSIPGTHDSAAYTQPWPFIATQSMDIAAQLNAGIRYFDLRCGLVRDEAEMVHGPRLLGLRLREISRIFCTWLDSHATEGLVVQIKEDRKSEKSTVHFAHAIHDIISGLPNVWRTANNTPCLGELRGKIQLLRRYTLPSQDPDGIGIDVTKWQDNPSTPFTIHTWHQVQLTIQDHYSFSEPLPLPRIIASKGGDVSEMLEKASGDSDPGHWYINFTSAYEFNLYYQITPRSIAIGGYYAFHWEEGMNPRLRNYLRVRPGRRRLGIVAMDFPESGSEDLIALVVQSNCARHKSVWRQGLTLVIVFVTIIALLFRSGVHETCVEYLLGTGRTRSL